ncbi:MAG: hypothetical protein WDN47_02885 [Candidatus Doudnabacteria bacterium]
MSQYILKIDSKTEALVGWDPPLQSYFGQIYMIDEDGERIDIYEENGEEKDGTIFWIGATPPRIDNVEELARKLSPYVRLSDDFRTYLFLDQTQNR